MSEWIAYYVEDPSIVTKKPSILWRGTERECRRAAALALGRQSLRGLVQAASERGTCYYSSSEEGASYVEIRAGG